MSEIQPQPLLAEVSHFVGYFLSHPFAETRVISRTLSDALVSRLGEQEGGVEPEGYALLIRHILYDHSVGHDSEGQPVRRVIQDPLRELLYRSEMIGWARAAVGEDFAQGVVDYYRQAEEAAARDAET